MERQSVNWYFAQLICTRQHGSVHILKVHKGHFGRTLGIGPSKTKGSPSFNISVKSADMNLKLALHAVSHMISDRNRHSGYQHLSEVGKQTLLVQYVPKWIRRWRIWVGSRHGNRSHLVIWERPVTPLQHQSFTSVACLSPSTC